MTGLLISSLVPAESGLKTASSEEVISANNQFGCELYSRYVSDEDNLLFSPHSIFSIMAMVYEGARGRTKEEMQNVFHFSDDDLARRIFFREVYERIRNKNKPYQLNSANALWAQKDHLFLKSYSCIAEKYYGAKLTNLDFSGQAQAEASRLVINSWVEEATNKKIKGIIPPGMLTPAVRLVLTNAVYFKGFWDKQFDKKETKEKDFKLSSGAKVKAQMMSLTGKDAKFNYNENDDLQVLELPYKGRELSMLILLPRDGREGFLHKYLELNKLKELKSGLQQTRVYVYLPRFKFETKYSFIDTLESMGMVSAFYAEADFSGMTGARDLSISAVLHKAFIEVNEEGTEAAAATAAAMKYLTAIQIPEEIKVFNADRPFIFIIQEKENGNILFLGKVNNPTS